MTNRIFALAFMFLCFAAFAQDESRNLVPNNGFETFVSCPDSNGAIKKAEPWFTSNGNTVDFFHTCAPQYNRYNSIPQNARGHQSPFNGSGMAGIWTYIDDYTVNSNYREFLSVKLKSPLVAGEKYYVSFMLSLADTSTFNSDDIGLLITDSNLLGLNDLFAFQPQLEWEQGNVVEDKNGWQECTFFYTANGGEEYIYIGNFLPDNATTLVPNNTISYFTGTVYFYLDEIVVEPCDSKRYFEVLALNDSLYAPASQSYVWTKNGDTLDWTSQAIRPVGAGIYAVVITDKTGCVRKSDIEVEAADCVDFSIYPNPAYRAFSVDAGTAEIKELLLVNAAGQKVFAANDFVTNKFHFDINKGIAPGVYTVMLSTNFCTSFKKMVISQ